MENINLPTETAEFYNRLNEERRKTFNKILKLKFKNEFGAEPPKCDLMGITLFDRLPKTFLQEENVHKMASRLKYLSEYFDPLSGYTVNDFCNDVFTHTHNGDLPNIHVCFLNFLDKNKL